MSCNFSSEQRGLMLEVSLYSMMIYFYKVYFQASNNPDYTGPTLGPKMATENKRNFSNCTYEINDMTTKKDEI